MCSVLCCIDWIEFGELLFEEYGWRSFVCSAHRLQNAIKHALTRSAPSLENLVSSAQKIVAHFNKSTKANEALLDKQRENGEMNPVKLVQDVSTRWNSVFYMLKRLVRLQEAVTSVLNKKDTRHLLLTNH